MLRKTLLIATVLALLAGGALAALPPKDTQGSKATGVTYTIGAEAANVIRVTGQLKWAGENPDRRLAVTWYLSTDSGGGNIAATAPTGGVVQVTGVLIESIADKHGVIVTTATGSFSVDITDTGTPTFYLVAVLPTGDLVVSAAITFA